MMLRYLFFLAAALPIFVANAAPQGAAMVRQGIPKPDLPAVRNPSVTASEATAKASDDETSVSLFGIHIKLTDGLLVLFTGLLWVSTQGLWKETRKAGAITEKAVEAALQSAGAASKSAELAQASLEAEHPRLIVASITQTRLGALDLDRQTEASWDLEISFRNIGRRSAEITRTTFSHLVATTLPPNQPTSSADTVERLEFGMILEPGQSCNVPWTFSLSAGEVQEIKDRRTTLWVYGVMAYKDVQDESTWQKGFVSHLDLPEGADVGLVDGTFKQPRNNENVRTYAFTRRDDERDG